MEHKTKMRRFVVVRREDETGISGTGIVAEGVVFWDGTCVIKWTTDTSSLGIYKSHVEMIHLHGHGGKTFIKWIDEKQEDIHSNSKEENIAAKKVKNAALAVVAEQLQKATGVLEEIQHQEDSEEVEPDFEEDADFDLEIEGDVDATVTAETATKVTSDLARSNRAASK